ncbi:hypothetical protein PW035_34675 [Nonomuraea angiospora]|nr:hypothetical protein [Nonomuraea angiospora]MDX3106007.1 hypothetical protein [Nonomuraea angiospora]
MSTVIQASTEIDLEDASVARKQSKESNAKDSDRELVARLVDQARAEGVELVGENGLLGRLTKLVLESALEGEITDHLGYDKHERGASETGNRRRERRPHPPAPQRPNRRRQHPCEEDHATDARPCRIRPSPPPHPAAMKITQRHHRLRDRATDPWTHPLLADEAGQSLRPPKARTWSRRGCPPSPSRARAPGAATWPGSSASNRGSGRSLIYRMMIYRHRKNERKGVHRDRLRPPAGRCPPVARRADRADLGRHQHPRRRPDAQPDRHTPVADGVLFTDLRARTQPRGDRVFEPQPRSEQPAPCPLDDLAAIIRSQLKQMQYRPDLLNAFLAHTGLGTDPRST